MEVILKKDVQNIGEAGDIVNVKDGYARNYLFPQNFAELATKGAKENREKNLTRIKIKQEKLHAEALETAKKIEAAGILEFSVKAGESGKLFGAVTTKYSKWQIFIFLLLFIHMIIEKGDIKWKLF